MAGCQNGCVKRFQEVSPRALYFHCASHELNLALSHASKVVEIYHKVCTLKSVGIFFKYSPKQQRELEQCIVSVSERAENTSEGECETGDDTVTTDDDSGSEDDDYGGTGTVSPKSRALCPLLPFTLPSTFLDSP